MLLMLDNYDSFTYNIVQYFGELGQDVRTYRNDERAKCAADTPLTSASRLTGHASCEAASMRSLARSRRRSSAGSCCASVCACATAACAGAVSPA